jgi:hypothetical protein
MEEERAPSCVGVEIMSKQLDFEAATVLMDSKLNVQMRIGVLGKAAMVEANTHGILQQVASVVCLADMDLELTSFVSLQRMEEATVSVVLLAGIFMTDLVPIPLDIVELVSLVLLLEVAQKLTV